MVQIINGDCRGILKTLPATSVQCVCTSPPYWGLRDYGHDNQIGLEPTPQRYVATMVQVFNEIWRVLRNDGTVWLNLGDSYMSQGGCTKQFGPNAQCGNTLAAVTPRTGGPRDRQDKLKTKDLVGIPWRVAFALQKRGWYLRQDIIWHKPSCMPESVTDRCTKAHEYIFLLTKNEKYFYDAEAIKEPSLYPDENRENRTGKWEDRPGFSRVKMQSCTPSGKIYEMRNKRSVWSVTNGGFPDAHFATFPPDLIKPCILAGSKPGDTVLDPFGGSGTTGMVATELGRRAILIELNQDYCKLSEQRCNVTPGLNLA